MTLVLSYSFTHVEFSSKVNRMNVDAVKRIRAKAEAAESKQADFLNERAGEISHFVRERAITEMIGEQLAIFLSKDAIELASSDSEIEQAVSDLVFMFTKRAAALDIEIKAE